MTPHSSVHGEINIPDELISAVHNYEKALLADDLDALSDAFEPSENIVRTDERGPLIGQTQIKAFRGKRGGITRRTLRALHIIMLDDATAFTVGTSEFETGGKGAQTQLWRATDGIWRMVGAHVTSKPKPFDTAIWRTVGDPFIAPSKSAEKLGITKNLTGFTVAVKDLYAVAGQPIGAGNPTYLAGAPIETAHADAVQQLLDAGAAIRGIARTDEFAYSIAGVNDHYGTPLNSAAPHRIPGGSSSGSASAVSAGLADIGLGTDTAGSVRIPASYQGLWGLRTSHGAVSRVGVLPLAPSFDTVGWLTRDVETLQRVVTAVLPESKPVTENSIVVVEDILELAEPTVIERFEALVGRLEKTGMSIRRERLANHSIISPAELYATFRRVQAGEAWDAWGNWIESHPDALGASIQARFEAARDTPAAEVEAAQVTFAEQKARIREFVGDAVLLYPTAPGAAPELNATGADLEDARAATLAMTALAGIGGLPSLSAPCLGTETRQAPLPSTSDDAPVGVCATAAAGADGALVAWAREHLS